MSRFRRFSTVLTTSISTALGLLRAGRLAVCSAALFVVLPGCSTGEADDSTRAPNAAVESEPTEGGESATQPSEPTRADEEARSKGGLFARNIRFGRIQQLQRNAGGRYAVEPSEQHDEIAETNNPNHGLATEFGPSGPTLRTGDESSPEEASSAEVRLVRIGRPGAMDRVPDVGERTVDGNRVEYERGPDLTEWYVNGPLGLEQGFDLAERPAADTTGPLVVELGVSGGLQPVEVGEETVAMRDRRGETKFHYRNVAIRDANGTAVAGRMSVRKGRIRVRVDDAGATYPLRIDPAFGSIQSISTNVQNPQDVVAADLDGDGDNDVLSASTNDDKVAWYENQGGSFGSQQIITTNADGAWSIAVSDLDGDGDNDVLSVSINDNKVAWYENQGGSFGSQQTITTNVSDPRDVHAADLDGDGDADVLSASKFDDKVAWYENQGGSFGSQQTISTSADRPREVDAADLDRDGDLDVLAASNGGSEVLWFENQSSGFSSKKNVGTVKKPFEVETADLDGDGDQDVLSATRALDKLFWFENQSGGFASRTIDNNPTVGPIQATDLDGDTDPDVLIADGRVGWYENQGGSFGSKQVITASGDPPAVFAADLDGDGDRDVVSAVSDRDNNRIFWLENRCRDPDGDGVCGSADNCPATANASQTDSDGDGTGDACAGCPNDPNKSSPGVCGCGNPDTDADGDGFAVCNDCDDSDDSINPNALETCDGRDNDCDGNTDNRPSLCGTDETCFQGSCTSMPPDTGADASMDAGGTMDADEATDTNGPPPGDDTGGTMDADEATDTDRAADATGETASDGGNDDGCGCGAGPAGDSPQPPSPGWWALLVFGALLARRNRRSSGGEADGEEA